jgi:predicted alpha/beta-fold hydrolase
MQVSETQNLELLDAFTPHPLARGGHLQTIAGRFGKTIYIPKESKPLLVDLPDGDRVYFMISVPLRGTKPKGVVALFHGLGGNSESLYNLRIAAKLQARGFICARYSHRGTGVVKEAVCRKTYNSTCAPDLYEGLALLGRKFPDLPIMAVGFSLSGGMLLNLLGKHQDLSAKLSSHLTGALAICPPINLRQSSDKLCRRTNLIYDQYFARRLVKQVRAREMAYPDEVPTLFKKPITLRSFDETYTAPRAGFASAQDYYEACSPENDLARVTIRTQILGAKDDPVVAIEPYFRAKLSPQVKVALTKSGGHMGFLSARKTDYNDFRWMDDYVVRWVERAYRA